MVQNIHCKILSKILYLYEHVYTYMDIMYMCIQIISIICKKKENFVKQVENALFIRKRKYIDSYMLDAFMIIRKYVHIIYKYISYTLI